MIERTYSDFQDHLIKLESAGLLRKISRPINKDTELHPLVRWQFRGGVPECERKAWFFENVVDSKGRRYDMPVVVGALATTPEVYRIGMAVELDAIGKHWEQAIANPIPPIEVNIAPCQETIWKEDQLVGEGKGLDALPIPISTPGYDCAPYFTATNCTTKDPETGVQNMGTYRAGLKSSNRLCVRMASRTGGAGGYEHWCKYRKLGKKMPCAFVIGAPPHVAFTGPQKLPKNMDEMDVAGGLAGEPIHIVRCKTVDLTVPADAELVIEGFVETDYLEPEAPFGESHGHIALEEFNMQMHVTAITSKTKPVLASIISQVTPSESSVIKRVAYEPMFLAHLRDNLGIQGIENVTLHEPLTNLRKVAFIRMTREAKTTEIWRALYGISNFRADCGKYVVAVSEDINPLNGNEILWSITQRANPIQDIHVLKHRAGGHGPKSSRSTDSTMLIDATIKSTLANRTIPSRQALNIRKARQTVIFSHLQDNLGIQGIKKIAVGGSEPSTPHFIILTMERGSLRSEIWRALNGTANFRNTSIKLVVAVDDDIDPYNSDSIFWALAYRCNPALDSTIISYGEATQSSGAEIYEFSSGSSLLIDATMEGEVMPPLALPTRQFMEKAAEIWKELELPTLNPEMPWFGPNLGDWNDRWEQMARRAAEGNYAENGRLTAQQIERGLKPGTPLRQLRPEID